MDKFPSGGHRYEELATKADFEHAFRMLSERFLSVLLACMCVFILVISLEALAVELWL